MAKRKLKSQSKSSATRWAKKAKPLPLPPEAGKTWDTGASGPAARAREQVVEDAFDVDPETGEVINPNGIRRIRIVDMLEVWHKRGVISTGGFNAAEKLRDAFEATARAPGWPDNDRVQSSPKPDHAVTIQIDRISRFHAVNRLVPAEHREIIDCCVLLGSSPAALRQYRGRNYQDGLQLLAAALDHLSGRMGS